MVHDPENMTPALVPGGDLEALEQLKDEGIIRAIGIGVANPHHLQRALDSDRFDVILIPYAYNLLHTTATSLLRRAAERNEGCINASPFQMGLLAGLDPDDVNRRCVAGGALPVPTDDLVRARTIWRWAQQHGADLRALAVQFCLRQPDVATTLLGPRTATEVEEDIAAALTPIPASTGMLCRSRSRHPNAQRRPVTPSHPAHGTTRRAGLLRSGHAARCGSDVATPDVRPAMTSWPLWCRSR